MDKQQLEVLSHNELIQRILDLELLLQEFQESSKELELGLEEELVALEADNTKLESALADSRKEVKTCNTKINDLSRELNELHESHANEIKNYTLQMDNLKQQIVSVEISNDNMESNDRLLSHKLELSNQFNNDLLERLALVESDLEREKKANLSNQLYISNYQNQVDELQRKLDDSDDTPNTTILGISDALADCYLPVEEVAGRSQPLVESYSKIELRLPSRYDLANLAKPGLYGDGDQVDQTKPGIRGQGLGSTDQARPGLDSHNVKKPGSHSHAYKLKEQTKLGLDTHGVKLTEQTKSAAHGHVLRSTDKTNSGLRPDAKSTEQAVWPRLNGQHDLVSSTQKLPSAGQQPAAQPGPQVYGPKTKYIIPLSQSTRKLHQETLEWRVFQKRKSTI